MAAATERVIQVPPQHCPPDTAPRLIARPWADGLGRIRYCRVPYTCNKWQPDLPIPKDWIEVPQPSLITASTECLLVLTATPNQEAAGRIDRSPVAAASRLPRAPRQARTPRPARPPRPPRAQRPARRPRPPRKPRPPKRVILRPIKPAPTKEPPGVLCMDPRVWPPAYRPNPGPCSPPLIPYCENYRSMVGYRWPESDPCPNYSKSACATQATTFVRPLQQLLGWKRPELPPPTTAPQPPRPRPRRPAPPPRPAPAPPAPGAPPITYIEPKHGDYLCIKDGALNHVDCYTLADGIVFWSNWKHGIWAGEPAPPDAPYGAGIGA